MGLCTHGSGQVTGYRELRGRADALRAGVTGDGALDLAQPVPGLDVAGVGDQPILQVGVLPLDHRRRWTLFALMDA